MTSRKPAPRRFLFDGRVLPVDKSRSLVEASEGRFRQRGFGIWLASEPSSPELARGEP
jgi:hypothetical protein